MVSILFLTHDKYDKNIFSKKNIKPNKGLELPTFWVFFFWGGGGLLMSFQRPPRGTSKGGPFRRYVFPVRHGRFACGASSGWTPLSTFISTIATAVIALVILIFFWGGGGGKFKKKHEVKRSLKRSRRDNYYFLELRIDIRVYI